jgi:type III pantothenate kinase
MTNLVVDAGNTFIKIAVFNHRQLAAQFQYESEVQLESVLSAYVINNIIIGSVTSLPVELLKFLKSKGQVLILDHKSRLPITNKYKTPETLGNDRLAAAVGSTSLVEGPVLSIDAGTCIKLDFVNENKEYLGGSISPGLSMRLKAMHEYTSRLPLLELGEIDQELIGVDTMTSMLSGVLNGAIAEVNELVNMYKDSYPSLNVVLTGGDRAYFEKGLKNTTFVEPHLVLKGLNEILLFNVC